MFLIITGINEPKKLTKHVSCKCECKFDDRKCNLYQKWNNNECRCECKIPKEHLVCEKKYIWNQNKFSFENSKYVGSIIYD